MKAITSLILLFSSSLLWANNNIEIGRSLANYEACTEISVDLDDHQMFFYYKKMFNDISLELLSLDNKEAKKVYRVWQESEHTLRKLNGSSMAQMCLSRFDELSRQMINK